MKKWLLFLPLVIFTAFAAHSQCTTPNPPSLASLILNATDTQLATYFDTTANVTPPSVANIRYLGIISTSATLASGPVNGTVYNVGDNIDVGTVIFYDRNYIHKQTGLIPGTTYYIFVYTARTVCTGEPFYSAASISASATMFASGPGIPPGYYASADALACSPLKTALFNIIKPTVANPNPTYSGLWSAYFISDDHQNDAANKTIVWDVYTDNPTGTECEFTFGSPFQDKGLFGTSECQIYNREHSFPKAWFGGNVEPMLSDMFIVFPTDKKVNGNRGNSPYGVVTSPTYTSNNGSKLGPNTFLTDYTGTAFEPINTYKGDLARSTFYVATAYEANIAAWAGNSNANNVLSGNSYPAFDNWYLKMLYQWHILDPVSTKEIDRNNDIYMIQGTRNPYIDHPEYAALVWQCTGVLPVTIIDFTGMKLSGSVLLKWYATYETNFKKYEVQRSTDGIVFTTIGEITGQNLANYSFVDNKLPSANIIYYRLKMIDIDDKADISKTVTVRSNQHFQDALVFPNPTAGKLTVQLEETLTKNSQLIISDITGRLVSQRTIDSGQKIIDIDPGKLAPGRYFIKISNCTMLINKTFVLLR